jgi:MFS transporter, FHS family, L-fucose permease
LILAGFRRHGGAMHGNTDLLDGGRADRLFRLLIGVYLSGGLLNSIITLLVPRLRLTMGLDYTQASWVNFAYYSSYLLFALPIALGTLRLGHMRSIASGLGVMAIGCLLLVAALNGRSYPLVLLSLLVISSGVTFLQISGNAVTTAFGASTAMASRFTLLQAFNSFGTVVGPLVGSWFLLGGVPGRSPATPFLVGAIALVVLAALFFFHRRLLPVVTHDGPPWSRLTEVVRQPRILGGIVAIFAYVGAEVTLGTHGVSYLMLPAVTAVSAHVAGRLISLYWAGAMIGRFVGAFAVKRVGTAPLLQSACCGAMVLLLVAILLQGDIGAVAMLAIGLCNSVMFPLTYALALPDAEEDVPLAAMLLCMAVVGGAIVPVVTGMAADRIGLAPSLLVPGLCYGAVFAFGRIRGRSARGAA